MKKGRDLGGVRSVNSLKAHCRIDQETGCWRWAGAVYRSGHAHVNFVWPDGTRYSMAGRRAAVMLKTMAKVPAGLRVYRVVTCAHADCVNPSHCAVGTPAEHCAAAKELGAFDTPAKRAQIARLQQGRRKISREVADAVRVADGSASEVGERFGISRRHVQRVREGSRKPTRRVASVFELARLLQAPRT